MEEAKTFLTTGNEYFLTYPRCDVGLADILAKIRSFWATKNRTVVKYLISSEEHKDEGLHRHAYFSLDRPYTNRFDCRVFDINDHHPNIQAVRKKDNVIGYVAKDGTYETNIPLATIDRLVTTWRSNQDKLNRKKAEKNSGIREVIGRQLLSGELELKDLAVKYPSQLYYLSSWEKSLKIHQKLNRPEPKKLDVLDNYWVWGPPGSGKTEWAHKYFGESIYDKPADKWWNGYRDQQSVIINDIGKDHQDVVWKLKIWAEHRPFNAEQKHDDPVFIRPTRIIVTSNYTISQLLELLGILNQQLHDALARRFTVIHIPLEPVVAQLPVDDYLIDF